MRGDVTCVVTGGVDDEELVEDHHDQGWNDHHVHLDLCYRLFHAPHHAPGPG